MSFSKPSVPFDSIHGPERTGREVSRGSFKFETVPDGRRKKRKKGDAQRRLSSSPVHPFDFSTRVQSLVHYLLAHKMIPLFFSSIFSTVLRDFIFADFSKVHVVERERKMCRFVFIFEQKVIERERKTVLEIGIICGRTRSRFSCGVNDATSR